MSANIFRKGAALAAAALLLNGCSVGEDYQRPQVAQPLSWSDGVAAGEWPSATWWRSFNAPDLDAYVRQASEANLDLAVAVARVRQADAQVKVSGASLLPSLDGGSSATRSHTPVSKTSNKSNGSNSVQSNSYAANLSASYEIDFWGKNQAAVDAANASAQGSRFDRQTTILTVQSSVATTYFAILGANERLRVARENLKNAEDVLSAIQDRMQAGTATDLDVAQQESQVASTRTAIPPLEQSLRQNTNALAVLLGKLPENIAPPTQTLAGLSVPAIAPGLPSELLERRPDVRSAEQTLISTNADITQARAALFPSIKLTGQYGYQSTVLHSLLDPSSTLWNIATSLTQPIYRGGALEGGVELTKAKWDEVVATYRKTIISAFSDVEDALVALQKTTEEERSQLVAEQTALRAYAIAQDQLRGGLADITTVLNVQKALFQAEDNLAQARINRLQAAVTLYKALGGGWDGTLANGANG